MSNVGIPDEIAESMYERAITHPSRGRSGNPRSDNQSGLVGAFQHSKRGKWKSRIRVNGKPIYLRNKEGKTYFHSAEEAHQAYIEAAIQFGIIIP